jgi:hypothetical protein
MLRYRSRHLQARGHACDQLIFGEIQTGHRVPAIAVDALLHWLEADNQFVNRHHGLHIQHRLYPRRDLIEIVRQRQKEPLHNFLLLVLIAQDANWIVIRPMHASKSSTDSPSRNVSTSNSRLSKIALAFRTRRVMESHAAFAIGLLVMESSISGSTALAITSNDMRRPVVIVHLCQHREVP